MFTIQFGPKLIILRQTPDIVRGFSCSQLVRGHKGPVVTHSPPTSEVCDSNPGPYVASWWLLTNGRHFTVQNLDQLYVLVSTALKTTHRDMTCTVPKVMLKPK